MARVSILVGLLMWVGVATADAANASEGTPVATPPARPIPLTPAQFEALRTIERDPLHRTCRDVPASYSEKAARLEGDLVHYGFQLALPTTLLIVLIAAAPL